MLRTAFTLVLAVCSLSAFAQKKRAPRFPTAEIDKMVTLSETEVHLRFLASDEMRGRDTGSPELEIAAAYIAREFQRWGIKTVPGAQGYFQPVPLERSQYATVVDVTVDDVLLKNKEDVVLLEGASAQWQGEVVFVGYGTEEDLKTTDVSGKLVLAYLGAPGMSDVMQMFFEAEAKGERMQARNAAGLIEIVNAPGVPWPALVNFFTRSKVGFKKSASMPRIWMKNSDAPAIARLIETKKAKAKLSIEQPAGKPIPGRNVLGWIEGTDPKLKNEFVALTAHYDHVGVGRKVDNDSIYNGTRDNAVGTAAVLQAARFFAAYPQKRSVLVMAVTAEEQGLLGSRWYADHPVLPLEKIVFNLNCDQAGYNDTTRVTLVDFNRTTADEILKASVAAYGLSLEGDPVPEQNLFERSDNFSFAAKGVPAVMFTLGLKSFDGDVMKYYHQPADEVNSISLTYVNRYIRAYVLSAHQLLNVPVIPTWKPGDKYEAAGKKLYGR
jgi:Zn-dependent M28 family amino/carboxypeptidase